ncbi:hypothetical protein Cni_G19132 [Canna indica]|uniref:PB1 domain-containing protein n=1 Tax=Canna indica TaxID=4628 RepID=A0AAQ3KK99_9LILI|nr:hypothetical protein Cni_G19132 [Canna indica]
MKPHNHHAHHHSAEADSSAASTPRASAAPVGGGGGGGHLMNQHSLHLPPPPPPARWHPDDPSAPLVRLMCSYGGRILPRPHDNQLRYVGGETRIVAVPRSASFAALISRLSKLLPTTAAAAGSQPPCLKYQLPNEDLDALVSLTSDEDVENMFDEYDRLAPVGGRAPRLRLFLFPSLSSAFGSVVDSPGSSRDQWFVDALNGSGSGPRSLDRGRSEVSSIISEVPDYLFGLDANSDEQHSAKARTQPVSEPDSPFSTSSQLSVPPIPDPPQVKTKPEVESIRVNPVEPEGQQQAGLMANPDWPYSPEPAPVYYVPGPVHGGSPPVQQVQLPVQYVQSIGSITGAQVPLWFQQPFPGVPIARVQSGPVYVSGSAIGPGTALGGGHHYSVGRAAETYKAPREVFVPVYQSALAGGEEAMIAGSETKVGKPVY